MKRMTLLGLLLSFGALPFAAQGQEAADFKPFDESLMPRAFAVGATSGGAGPGLELGIFDGDEGPRVEGARCTRIFTDLCACVAANVGHCYPEVCNSGCYGY